MIRRRAAEPTLAALVASLALLSPPARATPTASDGGSAAWLPPPDGTLGVWQLAGPVPDASRAPPATARWRSVVAAPSLDLARLLGGPGGHRAAAWLSVELSLPEATPAWLLVSADGGVRAFLDDAPVWRRAAPHPRGVAWDAAPLELPAGRHRLTLGLSRAEDRWSASVRLLDRRTLRPPAGLTLEAAAPGSDAARAREEPVSIGLAARWAEGEERLELTVRAPGGLPSALAGPLIVRDAASGAVLAQASLDAASLPLAVTVGPRRCAELPATPTARALRVEAGPLVRERSVLAWHRGCEVASAAGATAAALRAASTGRALHEPGPAPTGAGAGDAALALRHGVMAATLEHLRQELEGRAGATGADALRAVVSAADAIEAALDGAVEGAPLERPGVRDLALPPLLGLGADRLALHVPAEHGRDPARRWPLVVLLHGWGGTPRSVLKAFLDRAGSAPVVPGFVLAPDAFGDLFYRGAGERAALEAVRAVTALYPIDPDRVTVTGVSMGGTGVAHLALRYPELFAAAAPHCGYHSFFIRRDVQGLTLRPFERDALHHLSPASWAAAGRGLGWYVAHGTRDEPLANSRVLIEALRGAGVPVRDEWPEIGHDVHTVVWDGAQGFPWLAERRREPAPRRFTVLADSLRYGQGRWVRPTALEQPGRLGRIDVELGRDGTLRLVTSNLTGLVVEPPPAPGAGGAGAPLRAVIDGAPVELGPAPAHAHREAGGWRPGPAAARAVPRRPDNDGPILDTFLAPTVFVYGTLSPATARANREVAEALAARFGGEALLPVAADTSPELARQPGNRVLVGTRDDHALLAALGARVPFSVTGGALHGLGEAVARGGVGAVYTWPDPDAPARKLVIVTGTDAAGVWRALSLPALLPEYVVFDERLGPAAGRQVLGSAEVLAAGYFGPGWELPPGR